MKRFIRVVDDFYEDPDAIRKRAISMSYSHPETVTGWRTRCYQPRGIKNRIENRFGVRIPYWEEDLDAIEACNGVFFTSYSKGEHSEIVQIHYDEPVTWVMFLIYLSPNAPYDAGTSLWQHRSTGLHGRPTEQDAKRLGMSRHKLLGILERDSRIRNRWIEVDRIGNLFNRAAMFPGGFYHSATHHFGSNLENGRIYQSFHFPVKLLS